jgi:hypothetical protein
MSLSARLLQRGEGERRYWGSICEATASAGEAAAGDIGEAGEATAGEASWNWKMLWG